MLKAPRCGGNAAKLSIAPGAVKQPGCERFMAMLEWFGHLRCGCNRNHWIGSNHVQCIRQPNAVSGRPAAAMATIVV
jgi:hypothetical protein